MTRHMTIGAVSALLVTGCASMSAVTRSHADGEGEACVDATTEDRAWTSAVAVLRQEGADAVEEHRDAHELRAAFGTTVLSYGTLFGAWIEPVDSTHVRVTAVSKRKAPWAPVTILRESTFHRRLAEHLAGGTTIASTAK